MIQTLIRDVSEAVAACAEVDPDRVRVIVYEVPAENWGVGGVTKEDLP